MTLRFRYTGVRVRDLDRSIRFYTEVIGMKVASRGKMHNVPYGGTWVQLVSPGSKQKLELNWYPEGNKFNRPFHNGEELDHLAFTVDDVRSTIEDLTERGATLVVRPFRDGDADLAFMKDPDGIWIELIGRAKRRPKQ